MHQLWTVIDDVDRTHHGLGKFAAMSLVATRANVTFLPVAYAGTGKSKVSLGIAKAHRRSMVFDSITRNGMAKRQEEFNAFDGVVVVDDLGKVDNLYSRVSTITTLVELCYSHFMVKDSQIVHLDIRDFTGTAFVNCQPSVLKAVVASEEWSATVADKSLRYYHFYRPRRQNDAALTLPAVPEGTLDSVAIDASGLDGYEELVATGLVQWSRGRVDGHLSNLLRACAMWDNRTYVTDEDVRILTYLTMPMRTERYIMSKEDFDAPMVLTPQLLAMFTTWATYGAFSADEMAESFHMSTGNVIRTLEANRRFWIPQGNNPKRYAPSHLAKSVDGSRTMVDVVRDVGIDWPPADWE